MKCKLKTADKNPQLKKTSNNRNLQLSHCPVCGIRKSRFVSGAAAAAKDGGFLFGPIGSLIRGARSLAGSGKKTQKRRKRKKK